MITRITLWREPFAEHPRILPKSNGFTVIALHYASGVEGLKVESSRGHLVTLPWMGQTVWDIQFDGHDLTMHNMFSQSKSTAEVVATYSCFIFHSGLLANGRSSPEDSHPLHGETACAAVGEAWLKLEGENLRVGGRYEHVMGLGYRCQAHSAVIMHETNALFDIQVVAINPASAVMPLQYICHMDYAYVPEATFSQSISDETMKLRESISAHIRPTGQWLTFSQQIIQGGASLTRLNGSHFYNPEIVFLTDQLDRYIDKPEFSMIAPNGTTFVTRSSSMELSYVMRQTLYNGDRQVMAFTLPATC